MPPDQSQDNLEISKRDVLSSASLLKSRWPPLHIIFVDRLLLHIESPLLMLPPLVLIQQRCLDPCPGRFRSPLHDSSRTIDAYSSHHRFSSRSHERYDQRVAYSDVPAHWRRPLSRESPASRHLDFTSKSFSHFRGASPHGEPRRLTVHPVAFSEVLLSRLCHLLLRMVSTHSGARLLRGALPHGGPLRLLRGSSSKGFHVAYSKARLLQGITTS